MQGSSPHSAVRSTAIMADYRSTPRFREYSFQEVSDHDLLNAEDYYDTSYTGAQGNIDGEAAAPAPTIRLDKARYHNIGFAEPAAREGFGSRFLSSLSTNSPTAAALTRSGSTLHSRARSWAAYVPKLNPTPSKSPERASRPPNRIFSDFFNGESAPVQLGVPTSPTKEREDPEFVMDYKPALTERPSARRKESSVSTNTTPTPKGAKTSWFGRKQSTPAPAPTPTTPSSDEYTNMNIHSNLFPHGPADPLSPQAFNDLLLNATTLLQRLQAAYKEKVDYISTIQPEVDASREEAEEADTRAKHLKMQLEDIGRQNDEQKEVNKELIQQLAEEKIKLQEARESAKTIRLVSRDDEDSGPLQWTRKRGSAASASDSGFESDADTASLFSAGVETPRSQRQVPHFLAADADSRSQLSSRPSTMSSHKAASGADAAWATVERLRHEMRTLKVQNEQMERALEGCIEFIGDAGR